ncbi:MAG: MGMT family protein [Actinomycetota bacterium]|nr:MGMT family protein [Actinomycetota bacterium]
MSVDLHRVSPAHRRVLDNLHTHAGYGQTTTYGALAAAVGLVDDGARQVGAAMARNPVLIVIPCQRVLGAGNKLVGYAAGVATKQRLLDIETHDRAVQLEFA